MDPFLDCLFCSVGLCIYFYPNVMLFSSHRLLYILKSASVMPSAFVLFAQDCFGYLGCFLFPYKFQYFFISIKNNIGYFIGIVINPQIAQDSIFFFFFSFFFHFYQYNQSVVILTILIFPIHGRGMSFHFFVSSSIFKLVFYSFLCKDLSLLQLNLFICSQVFVILFFCNYRKWDFLHDFLLSQFVIDVQKTTSFYMLILYPTALLYLFFRSKSSFGGIVRLFQI